MKVEKIVSIETREHSFTVGSDFVPGPKREEIEAIVYYNGDEPENNDCGNGYSIFGISRDLLAFIPYHAVQVIFYEMVEK